MAYVSSMENTRWIPVPADRIRGLLNEIGAKVTAKGGSVREWVHGREVVFDIAPPNCPAFMRVYTSLAYGADEVRGCGEDAIRLVIASNCGSRTVTIGASRRIYRTAPKGPEEERIIRFLSRFEGAMRDVYADTRRVPACRQCGAVMVVRNGKNGSFLGCGAFPGCRHTEPLPAAS